MVVLGLLGLQYFGNDKAIIVFNDDCCYLFRIWLDLTAQTYAPKQLHRPVDNGLLGLQYFCNNKAIIIFSSDCCYLLRIWLDPM